VILLNYMSGMKMKKIVEYVSKQMDKKLSRMLKI